MKKVNFTEERVRELDDEMLFRYLGMQPISGPLPKVQRKIMEEWLVKYGRVPTDGDLRKEKIKKFFEGIFRKKPSVLSGVKNNQLSK